MDGELNTLGLDMSNADERAQRLVGTIHGTLVTAGILAVSGAGHEPDAFEAGLYVFATLIAFWLAHGWAHALGLRAAGLANHRLLDGLRHQLPVLEAAIPPLAALATAAILGSADENAISVALWVCVGELALLGAGVAQREGASPHRIAMTAGGCAALGLALVALKLLAH